MAGSCGSGTSASAQPCAANSRRRPVCTAAASSGSGWLVKNCHGRAGRPLLAHEQHRGERRGQQQRGADLAAGRATASRRAGRRSRGCRSGRGSAGTPRTGGPGCACRSTGRPCRRWRKLDQVPAWKNAPVSTVCQALQRAEVAVVALPLAGEQRVQGVVHVVVPLGLQAVAAGLARGDQPRVVEVGLGDQRQRPAQVGRQRSRPRPPAARAGGPRRGRPARARRRAAARRRGSRAATSARCR